MGKENRVLVIGSGGREQAIAEKLARSSGVSEVFLVPGNAGSRFIGERLSKRVENLSGVEDTAEVVDVCHREGIDLVVVGPEVWLEKELGNVLAEEGIAAVAPVKQAAMLELDKVYCRLKCADFGVPQPEFAYFTDPREALNFIDQGGMTDGVVKVAGPALGKGVIVCDNQEQLKQAVLEVRESFGSAADKILIEQRLYGVEVSYIVLSDGESFVSLIPALDYKRILDGNLGPNTGGMGSVAPNPVVTRQMAGEIERQIITPIIEGMRGVGVPYKGVLYAGVMLAADGPKLIEINARHGDPETQVQLPLLQADLYQLYIQVVEGRLKGSLACRLNAAAMVVVLAAEGYPGTPRKGGVIEGLEKAKGVVVYHSGTREVDGQVVGSGGRVLGVMGVGENLADAREKVYSQIGESGIHFEGMQFRRDIGKVG